MRRRIVKAEDVILLLSKIYGVSVSIARKFYFKANEVVEDAKVYIKLYLLQTECAK